MRHWILVVRVRMEAENCKFFIFDSMGIKYGSERKKKIKGLLMNIKLATKSDLWKVVKTRPQTEHECGIRMVMYMWRFRTWAMRHTQSSISNMGYETHSIKYTGGENMWANRRGKE